MSQPTGIRGNRFFKLRSSLRARVAFGVGLPVLLALATLSITHYLRERQLLEDQIETTSSQMGGLALGGLQHAMLTNDKYMLEQIIEDVGRMESVKQVQIVNLMGEVRADSTGEEIGTVHLKDSLGCVECHQLPASSRPQTTRLGASSSTLRISTPINNEEECWECHDSNNPHLGMVILDVSLTATEAQLISDLRWDIAISLMSTVLISAAVYVLVHLLIVRRVEAFQKPLTQFAAGDHNARLPINMGPKDEIGQLANTFNLMASELQAQEREAEVRAELKQRAIQEERERIARELHDGMAQILGYVSTKASAVRLMLKNKQEGAEEHLLQLEEAAKELFVDIREAILGLRMNGRGESGFVESIREYSIQYSRLSDIPVDLKIDPKIEEIKLDAEVELQLVRIVQEALANIRKHASASGAWIAIESVNGSVSLTVGDDGHGINQDRDFRGKSTHFGMSMMQERAEAIGAKFSIDSVPGAGTRITVQVDHAGDQVNARTGS